MAQTKTVLLLDKYLPLESFKGIYEDILRGCITALKTEKLKCIVREGQDTLNLNQDIVLLEEILRTAHLNNNQAEIDFKCVIQITNL